MIVKKNILYFIDILVYLCFTSYIGSFVISAFFASQVDVILKVILVALIAILIGACYIIGSAAQEWDLIQEFYSCKTSVNAWEIVTVFCCILFSICISIAFYGSKFRIENIGSVIFAVFIIPVVYTAGRITQDFITGTLAALFCIVLPVGAFSEKQGFVFSQGEGFLVSCRDGISTIGDGGVFVNILSRLEAITDFSSSLPKLIMCIFFFFAIWSGLFLFISKKNGGVFLTVYFNIVIVLQILFDFSDYFFLIIYPAAALTAAMGISFFVHKWIFLEDPEKGYDDATASSFENFQIVGPEAEEELKRKSAETGKGKTEPEQKTVSEGQIADKQEKTVSKNIENIMLAKETVEESGKQGSNAEAKINTTANIDENNKEDTNPGKNVMGLEEQEENVSEEGNYSPEGILAEKIVPEDTQEENNQVSREVMEPKITNTWEVMEQEDEKITSDTVIEDDTKTDIFMETLVSEEENTMLELEDEAKLLDQEEALLFASEEQDQEETAFFEELAASAREAENLRGQVIQAEEELTELTEKYQKQKAQLKELIQLLEQAKERQKKDGEEITAGKQKIVTLESEIQDLNKDIEEKNVLVREYRERSSKTEELMNNKLAEAERKKDELQKEAEEQKTILSSELELQRAEAEKYRRTSEEHRAKAEKYRQSAEENRLEAEQLKKEAEAARLEMENIRAENSRYKEDAENFRKQSEEYRQENTILLSKIDDLRERLEISERNSSKDELERLKAEKEHLETDYHSRIAELQEEKTVLEKKYKEELQKRKELLRRAKEEISKVRNQAARK